MMLTFVSIVKLMCMDPIARQKQESGLEGSCSDVIDCDVIASTGFDERLICLLPM